MDQAGITRRAAIAALSLAALSEIAPAESAPAPGGLYPGEALVEGAGIPAIVRFRPSVKGKPLIVFIPGGGHLARIAYGHPGARAADFLLPQLEARGFGTLALSYPSNHPAFPRPIPSLGVRDWSRAIAAITAKFAREAGHDGPIVAMGWSLGGRVARYLASELQAAGFALACFIGLSAAAPMPGLGTLRPEEVALSATGLWDASSSRSHVASTRGRQMDVVDAINGRVVIPRELYFREYLCDTPIGLRGEADRYGQGKRVFDPAEAVADQGTFDFAAYPLTGSIGAGDQTDARWSLTSAPTWAFFNAQSLYFNEIAPRIVKQAPIAERDWLTLQTLMDSLPQRLSRRVAGSHMFFVGERGASETARHVEALIAEITLIRAEIRALLRI